MPYTKPVGANYHKRACPCHILGSRGSLIPQPNIFAEECATSQADVKVQIMSLFVLKTKPE